MQSFHFRVAAWNHHVHHWHLELRLNSMSAFVQRIHLGRHTHHVEIELAHLELVVIYGGLLQIS